MNKSRLKTYAPAAREEFIKAVTERAHFYGISKEKAEPCTVQGDFAFITGRVFPKEVVAARKALLNQIGKSSFPQVIEEVAYTWFNRIAAIRFIEVNGYLSHGYRVLSHPEGHAEPEILEKAQFIERLDGLEKEEIIRLKMAAGKDNELYRRLLVAQCNDLNAAMPFLFERLDDPTELLLPDNLLNTDSVIRHLVSEIPEEDWREVEIIGWLYQFYISEKKDALMKAKKAYRTEDIPAVTQLFTPNRIVKYMVQNSLGAKWLSTYPASAIKLKMDYYIEPASQDEDVKARLKEITPTALNPEELTVLDPACGSGHILVEAYHLLKLIYLERGYREKDIPALILAKNLFGLEIDDRAAQLSGFALMMKARADDREIFRKDVRPNIVCLKSGNGEVAHFKEAKELIALFENARTFGSLIRVPSDLRRKLPEIGEIADKMKSGNMFEQKEAEIVTGLLKQAGLLSRQYDCVIANPPYMGGKWMNAKLKEFVKNEYKGYEKDLFSAFIIRGRELAHENGNLGFMLPFVWMFISSHEDLRLNLIDRATLTSLIQLEYSGFAEATVPICTFTFNNIHHKYYRGSFIRLSDFRGAENQAPKTLEAIQTKQCGWFYTAKPDDFKKIPGSPIAYWVSEQIRNIFTEADAMIDLARPCQGMATTNNDLFVRNWHEITICSVGFMKQNEEDAFVSRKKWFPYNKGGDFRKWYGNCDFLVNYENKGKTICNYIDNTPGVKVKSNGRVINRDRFFLESISWSKISSGNIALRYYPCGYVFDVAGCSIFSDSQSLYIYIGFLNLFVFISIFKMLSP